MPSSQNEHVTIEPRTIREGHTAYMLHCRSSGLAQNTIVNYDHKIDVLVKWLEKQGAKDLAEVTTDHLRGFFLSLKGDHNQGGVHAYYRPIKAMFRWLWDDYEWERRNPIDKVEVKAEKPQPKQGIPVEHFERIRDACHGHYKLRDQAILNGLLDTACRATEFCQLEIKDVNFVTGRVWVDAKYTKGSKGRAVRFGDKALRSLRKYLKLRGELKPTDPLFANDDEAPFDRFGLRSLVQRRADDAGVPCPGLHDFRRRGLYLLWKKTRDLKAVSEYAGHSNTEITLRYVATDEEDILDAHRNGSPVDNL